MDSALLQEFPPGLICYDFISVFRLLTLSVQKTGKFTLDNIPDRSLFDAYRKDSKLQTITNLLMWENTGEVLKTLLKYCHVARLTQLSNHFCL